MWHQEKIFYRSEMSCLSYLIRWTTPMIQIEIKSCLLISISFHYTGILSQNKDNVLVQMIMSPQTPSWRLSHEEVALFERIRRCGHIGESVPLGVGSEALEAHAKPKSLSAAYGTRGRNSQLPYLSACHHTPHHDDNGLNEPLKL